MNEEQKAIEWLDKRRKDYSLSAIEIHYLTIIYNLIIYYESRKNDGRKSKSNY